MVESLGLRVDGLWLRVKLANMRLCAVESGYVAMSSSAARKARIGEVPQAEGFGKNQRCNMSALPVAQESRFAADGQPLRLASSPLPLYRHWHGDTGGDIRR